MIVEKKRFTIRLSKDDLRVIELMQKQSGENINTLVKKALLSYYLSNFKDDKK
jgi:hypothetical protein